MHAAQHALGERRRSINTPLSVNSLLQSVKAPTLHGIRTAPPYDGAARCIGDQKIYMQVHSTQAAARGGCPISRSTPCPVFPADPLGSEPQVHPTGEHHGQHDLDENSRMAPHQPLPPYRGPYNGHYSGCFWTAQALFAIDPALQNHKQRHADHLVSTRDFLGLAETHGSAGTILGARGRSGHKEFWSHGPSSAAGIGLITSDTFLRKSNPCAEGDWEGLVDGRLGRLRLEGTAGRLDIYVVYMPSGNDNGARQERAHIAGMLGRQVVPQRDRLSIIMGDLNFVTEREDRITTSTGRASTVSDERETEWFQEHVWSPHGFHELRQPHFTYTSGLAMSRLDRIYSNHFLCDQLDRQYSCSTLPKGNGLSDRCAVAFGRRAPNHT